ILITAPFRPLGWTREQGISPWLAYPYLHVPAHISYLTRDWFSHVSLRVGLELQHWNADQDGGHAFEAVLGKPSVPLLGKAAAMPSSPKRLFERNRLWHLFSFGERLGRTLADPGRRAASEPRGIGRSVDYETRAAQETGRFEAELVVHDLPAIYHYWSNR